MAEIDGGADDDTWSASDNESADPLSLTQTDSASFLLSNGAVASNIEHLIFSGGSAADSITLLEGLDAAIVYGNGGSDSLTIDWSTKTGDVVGGQVFDSSDHEGYFQRGMLEADGQTVHWYEISSLDLILGSGDDSFSHRTNPLAFYLDAGPGFDTFIFSLYVDTPVNFSLDETPGNVSSFDTGFAPTQIANVEAVEIYTGGGDDSLTGGSFADVLDAGSGTNVINGRGGDDTLISHGYDTFDGGSGEDTVVFDGQFANYTVTFGDGVTTVSESDADGPVAILTDVEFLRFSDVTVEVEQGTSPGDETVYGTDGKDRLRGLDGNDLLMGLGRNDRIWGGRGEDVIIGGDGKDILYGDTSKKNGTSFADIFVFDTDDGSDKVMDFDVGLDQVHLMGSGEFQLMTSGNHTTVVFGDTTIFFRNATLTEADFEFLV